MKVILSIDNGLAEFHSYANGRELAGKVPFANTVSVDPLEYVPCGLWVVWGLSGEPH